MVQFIADHRAVFGVEPICAVLPIAPSTYHRHRHSGHIRRAGPPGRQRDDQLRVEIQRVYDAHQQVYGPGKSGSSCGGTASAWRAAPWRA